MEDTCMQKSMAWQQVGWNAEQQVGFAIEVYPKMYLVCCV
jgi:hypothetical protein